MAMENIITIHVNIYNRMCLFQYDIIHIVPWQRISYSCIRFHVNTFAFHVRFVMAFSKYAINLENTVASFPFNIRNNRIYP